MGYTAQPIHPCTTYFIKGLGINVLFIAQLPRCILNIRRFDGKTRFSEVKRTNLKDTGIQ